MIVFEKRGKHIGIKITLPTIEGQPVERYRHTYEALFSKTLKAEYQRTKGKDVAREIDNCDGEALLTRFPRCEALHLELRRRGWLKVSVKTTVDDLLKLAMDFWTGEKVRSLDDKQNKVNAVSREFPGTRLAHQVTADDIEAYRKRLAEAGYADQTIKHRLQTLQTAFNRGKLAEKIERVPYFNMPKVENEDDEDAYFEDEEVEALVRNLPEHLRSLVKVAHITGWRMSELTSRRIKDIHEMFLHLDKDHSKNGKERDFPLNLPGIREALDEQLAYVRSLGRITPWLFPTDDGSVGRFDKAWDTAVLKSGISVTDPETGAERRRLFRHLRNTAITNLLDMGVPVHMVMDLVGHRTIKMSGRYHQRRQRKMLEVGARVTQLMEQIEAQKAQAVVHDLDHHRTTASFSATNTVSKNPEKRRESGGFSGGQEWN